MGNNLLGWLASRIYNSEHISPVSTPGSTATGNHSTSSLMSLNPLAPAFLPPPQPSCDPPILLCNPPTMGIPLAQLVCGMLPQTLPSHIPSTNQHITDKTLLLPLLQPTTQLQPDAAIPPPALGPPAFLLPSLQHHTNCLQTINKTIKQFSHHLKTEQLDRQTLQLVLLQLQNDFALLRYLLFSNKDFSARRPAASPLPNPNLNPNPNPISTSSALPHSGPRDPTLHRPTPAGAVGTAKTKTNNTTETESQPTPNSQEAPSTKLQNLTSRISKLEKFFAKELSSYTSITAGTTPNTFSYTINFASSNLDIQMSIFGKFPQWNLYSTLQKWLDHHLISSLSRPQVLAALSSVLTPTDSTSS